MPQIYRHQNIQWFYSKNFDSLDKSDKLIEKHMKEIKKKNNDHLNSKPIMTVVP